MGACCRRGSSPQVHGARCTTSPHAGLVALDLCSTARQSRPAHPPVAGIRPRRSRPALHRRTQQPSRCGSPSSPFAIGRKLTTVSRARHVDVWSARGSGAALEWRRRQLAAAAAAGCERVPLDSSPCRLVTLQEPRASKAAPQSHGGAVLLPTLSREGHVSERQLRLCSFRKYTTRLLNVWCVKVLAPYAAR